MIKMVPPVVPGQAALNYPMIRFCSARIQSIDSGPVTLPLNRNSGLLLFHGNNCFQFIRRNMLTVSTPEAITQVLKTKLGLALKIDSILQRPDRCMALLPDSQMAVLATSETGAQLMRSERKILQALGGKSSFQTPTIEKVSDDETVDLRNRVSGNTNFNDILQHLNKNPAIAKQVTINIAAILAELHSCLDHSDRLISKQRILLYNAISAITFLAYRNGIENDTRWCGRTYDEDIPNWLDQLERLVPTK